jgi:uncharacterized membrane protein YbaN (DUF454 family)
LAQDEDEDEIGARGLRVVWLMFGHCCVGLATVGAFLPLLPTVPLLLLAAWAYARSSPALRQWLHEHPRFGHHIHAWQVHGAIPRRGKIAAVVAMAVSFAFAWRAGVNPAILAVVGTIMLAVGAYVVSRPAPDRS